MYGPQNSGRRAVEQVERIEKVSIHATGERADVRPLSRTHGHQEDLFLLSSIPI